MSLDYEFERIVGWFARFNGGVDHMRTGQASTEAMLARVEYELEHMRREVTRVKLDDPETPKAA